MEKLLLKIKDKLKSIDYLTVTASTVICALFSFIYSVYTKKYVEPYEFGIFSTCTILQNYLGYAQFGVLSAYNRDYPRILGEGNLDRAKKLRDTTFTFLLIVYSFILVIIIILMVAWFIPHGLEYRYLLGYIFVGAILLFETTSSFCLYTARIRGNYNYSAAIELCRTGLGTIVGLVLVKNIGYYGLYLKLLIIPILGILLYIPKSLEKLKLRIDKIILKNAVISGLPLMINSLIYTIMASVDKFVILFFMDTEALGVYTVPQMGFNTIVLIPQTISQIFYYKASGIYGKTNSEKVLTEVCGHYSKIISICTAASVVCAFYGLPIFVKLFMPKYASGIKPAQILIIGVALYGATLLYGNIFSILKWNSELITTSIILCMFNAVFSVSFVLINGRFIENVAVGTAISYALYGMILLRIISKKLHVEMKSMMRFSFLPLLITVVPSLILYVIIPNIYISLTLSLALVTVTFLLIWRNKILKSSVTQYIV